MAAFPSGDWTFTVSYIDGEADITTVPYREPEGGDIPLVTQEMPTQSRNFPSARTPGSSRG